MSGFADRVPGRARLPRLPRMPRREAPARPLAVDGRPTARERVYGLGSIFAKTWRDSRRSMLLGGIGLGLLVFFTASQVAVQFATEQSRAELAALPNQLPSMFRGLLGEPISIETLGGFLSWRAMNFMALIVGAWSIVALSGLIAGEAVRGSLDLVVATPRRRTSVALQKALGHVAAVAVVMLVLGAFLWLSGAVFGTLPGDEISPVDAFGHVAWLGVMALVPGGVAWALAPFLGRGAARGLAAVFMVTSFVVHAYRDTLPAFDALNGLSYFGLTAAHRPIAGVTDWVPVLVLAGIVGLLGVAGAAAFRLRDIGATRSVGIGLPRLPFGLGGPLTRAFADRFPGATWWGLGLGALGFVYALQAEAFGDSLASIPQLEAMIQQFFPNVDIRSTGGILQLVYFGFGTLLAAIAAATIAGGWGSDETDQRLEMVLSAPITRRGWAIRSGAGTMLAVAWFAVLSAGLVALGALLQGDDPVSPFTGGLVIGLYAAALVGVGIAVGGLVRAGLAGPVAVVLGLTFYLLDTLGVAIGLPDVVLDLSLTAHLGQPMAGNFDWAGMVACVVIAAGGVVLAAIGLGRRDITR